MEARNREVGTWRIEEVRIPFQLGGRSVFRATRPLLVNGTHFTKITGDAEQIDVPELPSGVEGALFKSHPLDGALPRVSVTKGFLRYVPGPLMRCTVDLRRDFETYLGKFAHKRRNALRRSVRRFQEHCRGAFRAYREPEDIAEFYRLARMVSVKTHQEKHLGMGLPDTVQFRDEMLARAAEDKARGYLLFSGPEPRAYLYFTVDDGIVMYRFTGYDPALADWSPGTVLHLLALESLFSDGTHRMLDFALGDGPHKTLLATDQVRCADIFFLRRNASNLSLVLTHAGVSAFSRAAGHVLDQLGAKETVHSLMRRGS
ncbi:MAG: GNAT family N-acetyltransferase [Deltaproteobacteria bacterium]|nr:GNAT family N-acetyltransferase [Deltaproteobacteria bacterium]